MKYDERLDAKSGFYRGWRSCLGSICKFLRENETDDAATMLYERFAASHALSAYRMKSPEYRRTMLRLVKGGKHETN